MSQLLPRFMAAAQKIEDERKLVRIVLESSGSDNPVTVSRATLPGDNRRLRGIPVCARGVSGAIPGTNPA